MEEDDNSYDFDNWHQNVPVDEDELKRKLKKKRKAEHKKIREEAKRKKEEEEKKKEGSDNESSDEEVDEEQAKRERRKEKREKKKEKKKEKKEKKRKREEAEITGEPLDSDEDSNKKQKKENSANGKKGEFGVWVGNLAFSTTEEMLKKFFANCGTITRINLPINKKTKNNKGFAYIDFEDEESMKKAIELSEQTLENRNLLIKSSKDFRGRPSKNSNNNNSNNNNNNSNSSSGKTGGKPNNNNKKESPTLFIGNLPYAATADGISKCFNEFGEISNVRVATFEDNQEKCKGFAYVDFANIESAIKAMNSGKKPKLLGRVLRVEYAGEDATRRGYNRLHKKSKENHKDNSKESKPTEPKPIAIAKWDGELVTFKGQKTVFNDDDDEDE
jgi:RNA recognition motif-containing protein